MFVFALFFLRFLSPPPLLLRDVGVFSTKGVTRNLRDAQRELLTFVDADTYLVGHSVDSDLRALKLVHRRLIDTSELYPSPRGAPFKVTPNSRNTCGTHNLGLFCFVLFFSSFLLFCMLVYNLFSWGACCFCLFLSFLWLLLCVCVFFFVFFFVW